jgi:hypothetical protein
MSGMDGGMGLYGSAELPLRRAFKYLKTQPLLGKSMPLEVTCQIYSNEQSIRYALTDEQ